MRLVLRGKITKKNGKKNEHSEKSRIFAHSYVTLTLTMKDFLKYTLATICGIILVGVVCTILFFMIISSALPYSNQETTKAEENSVFVLKLNGAFRSAVTRTLPSQPCSWDKSTWR